MSVEDKRKYPRVKIYNPIFYLGLDENQNAVEQNMAMALDISQNGIQLQTPAEIESEFLVLTATNLENKLVEIKGKVIYCNKNESRGFNVGIQLQGTPAENIRFVKDLLKTYHYGKKAANQ